LDWVPVGKKIKTPSYLNIYLYTFFYFTGLYFVLKFLYNTENPPPPPPPITFFINVYIPLISKLLIEFVKKFKYLFFNFRYGVMEIAALAGCKGLVKVIHFHVVKAHREIV
jgi:hypothetical protein